MVSSDWSPEPSPHSLWPQNAPQGSVTSLRPTAENKSHSFCVPQEESSSNHKAAPVSSVPAVKLSDELWKLARLHITKSKGKNPVSSGTSPFDLKGQLQRSAWPQEHEQDAQDRTMQGPSCHQDNLLLRFSHHSVLLLMRKGDLGDILSCKSRKKFFNSFFFAFLSGLRKSTWLMEACLFAKELGSCVPPYTLMKR